MRVVRLLAYAAVLILGFGVGLTVGALYGGNYAVDFVFLGQRGYEATGILGALVGVMLASLTVYYLEKRVGARKPGGIGKL